MVESNCSNCGRELPAGRRFCGGCGRPVAAIAEPAPAESTARFCKKCGAPYVPGKRFCKQCGHAVGLTVPTAANESEAVPQGESAATMAVLAEGSSEAPPPIAVPAQPEPAAILCSKGGAAIAPGKRFCKQCGHAVVTAEPDTARQSSAPQQEEPAVNKADRDEAPAQGLPPIAVPAPPELTAPLCPNCGAFVAPGKSFCKQCGHAIATPPRTAAVDSRLAEQGEPAARESIIPIVESNHSTAPPPQIPMLGQTLSTHIDTAPSEILPGSPSQEEPAAGRIEELDSASHEGSSTEEGFRPLFKFSGDEQAPLSVPPLQSDLANHDPGVTNLGLHEPDDRDAGMFSSFDDPATPRSRTLLLILGAVCVAALLGAAWFVIAHYYGSRRPVQTAAQPTPPVAVAISSADQPSKQALPPAPVAPIAKPMPAPPRQEVARNEAAAHRAAPTPEAADSHPMSQKNSGGNCALDLGMLSKMLDRADRNREQGNYADAARQYRSVLSCDSNNARAHNGLELTLLDIQHQ